MISKEVEVEIKAKSRDGWKPGTIAKALSLHPDVVKRVLAPPQSGAKDQEQESLRASILEPWQAILDALLEKHPSISATAVYTFLKGRGYPGSVYPVRRYCRQKKRLSSKAFLDLQFMPGEMAQVDWAAFGSIPVGKHLRKLHAFVMVLAYSRRIFARYFYDMSSARVLEAHALAFQAFGGIPRQVLYDNMKTAVTEHVGEGVRFNESLLELASHYSFKPLACNPRSGWEKGRVERSIRYLRDSFFAGRRYEDLADLNRQLEIWLDEVSMERPWTDDRTITVREAFQHEKLEALPREPFDPYEELFARVSKKAMLQFDTNLYPVDPEYVNHSLAVRATQSTVRILSEGKLIHEYPRLWSKHETLRVPGHQEKIAKLRKIKSHRAGRSAIEKSLGCGRELLTVWASLDENIQQASKIVLDLIPQHGAENVEAACQLALDNKTPRACSIAQILAEGQPAPQASGQIHLQHDLPEMKVNWVPTSTYDELCE